MDIQREAPSFPSRPYLARRLSGRRTVELYSSRRIARETGAGGRRGGQTATISREGGELSIETFSICAEWRWNSVCFIPPSPVFFRSLLTWGASLLRLVLLFQPRSARLLGYFYNDTLCNVNYCRRNELEEVFQDAASPHFSLSFLSRCYPPSLPFSFPLVSGAGMSKGCSLSLSLSSFSGRILRESPHYRALPRS